MWNERIFMYPLRKAWIFLLFAAAPIQGSTLLCAEALVELLPESPVLHTRLQLFREAREQVLSLMAQAKVYQRMQQEVIHETAHDLSFIERLDIRLRLISPSQNARRWRRQYLIALQLYLKKSELREKLKHFDEVTLPAIVRAEVRATFRDNPLPSDNTLKNLMRVAIGNLNNLEEATRGGLSAPPYILTDAIKIFECLSVELGKYGDVPNTVLLRRYIDDCHKALLQIGDPPFWKGLGIRQFFIETKGNLFAAAKASWPDFGCRTILGIAF
ncbi:MAG: hypothetical protein HY537_02900 [Deltaproteobacteria bacterium]|nr:hypothetical protein [Deltaproteobacteria bacterium]